MITESPRDLIQLAVNDARSNAVLGTAFSLGALEEANRLSDPAVKMTANLSLAVGLMWWGYHYDALPYLAQARKENVLSRDPVASAYLEWHWLVSRRRFYTISNVFQRLLDVADSLDQWGDSSAAMQCRLDAVSGSTASTAVLGILNLATQYFNQHERSADYGIALTIQAHHLITHGDFYRGCGAVEEAERIFIQQQMPLMLAYCWLLRGRYYYQRRQPIESVEWLQQAVAQADAVYHDYYRAMALSMLGMIQHEQGRLDQSYLNSQQAGRIGRGLRMKFLQADSYLTSAHTFVRRGKYRAAQRSYGRAKILFTSIDRLDLAAVCDMNLGIVARRQGDFGLSLQLLEEAVARFLEQGEYEYLAMAHHNLAKTYGAFAYVEPAIEHAQKSIDVLKKVGADGQMVRSSIYLARLLVQRGRIDEAGKHLNFASRKSKQTGLEFDEAISWQVRGQMHSAAGEHDRAQSAFRRSLTMLDLLEQPDAAWESQIGIVESSIEQGKLAAARRELSKLRHRALPAGLRWRRDAASARVAVLEKHQLQATHLFLSALQHMRNARITLEYEDHIEYFVRDLNPLYEDSFRLAVGLDDPTLALMIAELYGSQLLSVRAGYAAQRSPNPQDVVNRIRELMTRRLGANWTVLRFAWHSDSLWCFQINSEKFDARRIQLSPALLSDLRAAANPDISFRQFTYKGLLHSQDNAAQRSLVIRGRLFDSLLPDWIRSLNAPNHVLVIVPSGQLHGLAFHALLDGDVPLIERTAVLYAPSLQFLQGQLEVDQGEQDLLHNAGLICAVSQFRDAAFAPLHHIRAEVSALTGKLDGTSSLLENEFSQVSMQMLAESGELSRYNWLHFATHTKMDIATGAFTGLVTADGIINLRDIAAWKLNANVVTLSACQTGGGKWYYGDEIVGLAQTFLGSGAHSVIASMWGADDERTGPLMTSLYQSIGHGSTPMVALAEAQREAHRAGLEAYYWAPFCAFGQP
jgi:tetratricopeptide (TPR) repeat protein